MKRNRVHYRPGWDCHGLPIEMKAKSIKEGMNALEIRDKGMNNTTNKHLPFWVHINVNWFVIFEKQENLQQKPLKCRKRNLNHGALQPTGVLEIICIERMIRIMCTINWIYFIDFIRSSWFFVILNQFIGHHHQSNVFIYSSLVAIIIFLFPIFI